MSVASRVAALVARRRLARLRACAEDAGPAQDRVFRRLLRAARRTAFGHEHGLGAVRTRADWADAVPLRGYAEMNAWWARARSGEPDVSWPGTVRCFALSSGTTSGEKHLPVSEATIRTARGGAFDAMVPYLAARPDADLLGGKLLFLGGATRLREEGPSLVGDMTGILATRMPAYLASRQVPGPEIAAEPDWERKVPLAADESMTHDVRAMAGVPSWIVLFAETVLARARAAGRRVDRLVDLWPRLGLYAHGGMSFGPYRRRLLELHGGDLWCLDGWSASEGGMLSVQDRREAYDMLPILDRGTWFELVPLREVGSSRPTRLPIERAEVGEDYAVALNTDSGIWSYLLGDVVRFTSRMPLRLEFAGRIAHTLNAFGEHVSGGELDRAILGACAARDLRVREFAVAAEFPTVGRPTGHHVHYLEVEPGGGPHDLRLLALEIDRRIAEGNEDYAAHRRHGFGVGEPAVVLVPPGTFLHWMRVRGRFGGQNKVPRVLGAADAVAFARFVAVRLLLPPVPPGVDQAFPSFGPPLTPV